MGFGGVLFYYVLLGSMALLMAIRVGRSSPGMGVVVFLFWPLAVIPLMTNWGVRGSDIRLHFVLTLFATCMVIYKSNQAVDQLAMQLSADDIEMIRQSDPRSAAEIERRQLQSMGFNTGTPAAVESTGASRRENAFAAPAAVRAQDDELQFAAAPPEIRKVPLAELHFRRNQVRLGPAYAVLTVPEHFRFISAQQLGLLAENRGVAVGDHVLGWIVHERVDLGTPDFWFVEVEFDEVGHLAPPVATKAEAGPAGPPAVADDHHLDWHAAEAVAYWSSASSRGPLGRRDQLATRLLRHGAVVYRVPELDATKQELGVRAARLMVRLTVPEPGWSYHEFTGPETAQSLPQWILARESADTARADTEAASDDRGS